MFSTPREPSLVFGVTVQSQSLLFQLFITFPEHFLQGWFAPSQLHILPTTRTRVDVQQEVPPLKQSWSEGLMLF